MPIIDHADVRWATAMERGRERHLVSHGHSTHHHQSRTPDYPDQRRSPGICLAAPGAAGEHRSQRPVLKTWSPVDTLHPRTGYSWYRWKHSWNPPAAGKYTLMCRATNVNGDTQPMEFPNPWDGRGYGNNMAFPFDVVVSDR
jgi:hypothetical protein